MLKNNSRLNMNVTYSTPTQFQTTKSMAGFMINTLDISTQTLPGNFGIRVIDTMPTNLSDVWRERKNTQIGY